MTEDLRLDIRFRYLASAYVDAASIIANSQDTVSLLPGFGNDKLMPAQAVESGVQRLAFHSPDEGLTIALRAERFDVTVENTGEEDIDTSETMATFCALASRSLSHALSHFGRKAHRLAFVRETLLSEISEEGLQKVCRRVLQLPPPFSANPPFEWNWRAGSEIERSFGRCTEPTYTLVTARRVEGTYQVRGEEPVPFDRIRLDVDVNTTPKDTRARFDEDDVSPFFQEVINWQEELGQQVLSYFNKGIIA